MSKFERRHDFDLETHSLGKIRCGTLKVSTFSATAKSLADPNSEALPQCRNILQMLSKKIDSSAGDRKSSEIALSDDDVRQITDDEVEIFSKEFVSHNDWLLLSSDDAKGQNGGDQENESSISRQAEVDDLAKGSAERNSEYLIRILHRYFQDQGERLKKILEPLAKEDTIARHLTKLKESLPFRLAGSAFDASTLESLRRNLGMSDQLKDTLRAFEKNTIAREVLPDSSRLEAQAPPSIHPAKNLLIEKNRRLGSILDQIGEMRTLAAQSAGLIANMNQTALQMQANFISNARSTQKSAQVAIGIAVLSLGATLVFSLLSYSDGKDQSEKNNSQISLYQAEVAKLIAAQEKDRAVLVGALKASHQTAAAPAVKAPGAK
ncbi:MAG: hypothetical protein KDI64_01660 [Candidatus Accumulibacter sp.]|nr:hypothetical protein [Accumulibacter sp.]